MTGGRAAPSAPYRPACTVRGAFCSLKQGDFEWTIKKMTETRQSCRAFDPVRTPDRAVLTQVLEAARLAPSACNSQPYHFYVAVDGTARAVGAATQSLGMNKFAGDCPAFIVVAEQPYNRSAAVGAKLKD